MGQKSAGNKRDVAALVNSLSSLVTLLHGPLESPDRCPPALHERINRLSRSHFAITSLFLPVVSDKMWVDSSINEISGTLERIKQKQTLARAIRADGNEAKISTCVQTLKQGIDNFLVGNHIVVDHFGHS